MKVFKITLKDQVIKEVDGEMVLEYENEKTYPAFLTNAALKKGRDAGLIDSSLVDDIFAFSSMQAGDATPLDDIRAFSIIYLAFIGANPTAELSFDEFLEKYHASFDETLELYGSMTSEYMMPQKNAFAKGLEESTDKTQGKK